jgi:hypothetical protein
MRRDPRLKTGPGGRRWAAPLDEPSRVVGLAEGEQRPAQLLEGAKGPDPQEVSLQGPDEPLRASVPLGRVDEGGRALDAEEGDVALEVCRRISLRSEAERPKKSRRSSPCPNNSLNSAAVV